MLVRARHADLGTAPPSIHAYLGQTLVTAGKEYEVYAVAEFEGVVLVQIVDDLDYPSWRPSWLFEVVDSALPEDWICSMFVNAPALVLGPPFVAGSQEAYAAMVELEPEQVDRFWQRHGRRMKDDA